MFQHLGHKNNRCYFYVLKPKSWTAKNLLVNNLPQNVRGRDILQKLGIRLTATKPTGKTIGIISDTSTEQNIIKWIFKKYSHICTRLSPLTKSRGKIDI